MATGNITVTTLANWLPTHYLPDVQLGTINKSVMAPLVKRPDLEGIVSQSGEAVTFPIATGNTARDKAVNTAVTYDTNTESKITVSLNQHKYVARIIEKRTEIQTLASVMSAYGTQDGRAVAKAIDIYVGLLVPSLTQNAGALASATDYTDITDVILRDAIQLLDEAEAPEEDRFLVISPAQKNALLGIAKFVEADKSNNDTIKTGKFGEIYGVEVFISNNLAQTASSASVSAASPITTKRKECVLFQKDAFALVVQDDIDVILESSADHIGVKMVTDAIFGASISRDLYGVNIRVTAE